MIDFLFNLDLSLAPQIHQKSTQEAPKINKKSIRNNVQDMIPFFIFFSILEASWVPSWTHIETMLATKSKKIRIQKQSKQKALKKEGRRKLSRDLGGP